MNRIDIGIYSHINIQNPGGKKSSPGDVEYSRPMVAPTYQELLSLIAIVSFYNPKLMLLFRGQPKDYRTQKSGDSKPRSTVYPSIYRPTQGKSKLSESERNERFLKLEQTSKVLKEEFSAQRLKGRVRLKNYLEIQWAIIQHYSAEFGIPTPLLDLTDSLHIAATFATKNSTSNYGSVLVFGFPNQTASISHHVDDQILSVKLSSACPPPAKRAHFQSAYLVGSLPHNEKKTRNKDVSGRLIAKFKIPTTGFWGNGFQEIPHDILFPTDDVMLQIARDIRLNFEGNSWED